VIRLLIAAPSAVLRSGLEAMAAASPGLDVAGVLPDLSAVEALRPDVVLTALPLAEIAPVENGRAPAIVLLTNEAQPVWTPEALRLGVRALLPRDAGEREVLAAIDAAAAGLALIDPRDLDQLLAAAPVARTTDSSGMLTPRELEVLAMMAEGDANKAIAWKLQISEHTAKFHVASILAKLNAGSRTEAVAVGVRKGLVML
jgi:NarL family two-component system response regulator YdfI